MKRKSFWGAGIAAVFLIALAIVGSVLMYQTGWSRGYATGIVAAGAEDGGVAYAAPMYPAATHGPSGALWGLGVFMLFGLGFITLACIGKAFRMRAWHAMAGPEGIRPPGVDGSWSSHWRGHRPPHPWHHWHAPCQEQAKDSAAQDQADSEEE